MYAGHPLPSCSFALQKDEYAQEFLLCLVERLGVEQEVGWLDSIAQELVGVADQLLRHPAVSHTAELPELAMWSLASYQCLASMLASDWHDALPYADSACIALPAFAPEATFTLRTTLYTRLISYHVPPTGS